MATVTSIPPPVADQLLRRMAMLVRADSSFQDINDLAETSLACGDSEGALMLFGAAALERGFDDRALAWQFEAGTRTGLWNAEARGPTEPGLPMLEKAQRELEELLTAFPTGSEPDAPAATLSAAAEAAVPITVLPAFGDFVCVRSRQLLENVSIGSVAALATDVASATAGYLPFDLSMHAGAPAATLVRMIAFNKLRHFTRLHCEVLEPPYGSPALFDRASRLSWDGLGPYFANVSRLAKGASRLLGFLHLANGGKMLQEDLGRWALLLSVRFQPGRLEGFVQMLASLGRTEYLLILIKRAGRSADRETLWGVRDTCLTTGLIDVAQTAQAMLARISPRDWAERMILGDFYAMLGDLDTAEQTYRHTLALRPGEMQVVGRLAAIRSGEIKASIFQYGFFARFRLALSNQT